jgi:hypothetical protein
MTVKHSTWVHGLGIVFENRSWFDHRQGYYTTVRPSNESNFGYFHYVIPTPVIVDGARLKAESAAAFFSTGSNAKITNFRVQDGEKLIADFSGLAQTGHHIFLREAVPHKPEVFYGTVISIGVEFTGTGPDAWVQFIGAGIDFIA